MIEIFKKPIEYLFDETKSKLSKLTYLSFIFLLLIFVNDIFGFSFNHNISNKINNIEKIESIKKEYSENYFIDSNTINELNILENRIIENKSTVNYIFDYIKDLAFGGINIDISVFLSIQWFWIIMIFVFLSQIKVNGIKQTFGMIGVIFFIMFIWYFFTNFVLNSFEITGRKTIIFTNIILNLLFIVFIFLIGKKDKK